MTIKPVYTIRKMSQQRLKKVFIAIRPEFFDLPNEHITLAYFHSATVPEILTVAERLRRFVPTEIEINGFANWKNPGGQFNEVALIDSFKNPALFNYIKTPHITIRTLNGPVSNATFVPEIFGQPQIVENLWLGRSVMGDMKWIRIESEDIMATAIRSWEAYGTL